MADVLVRGGTVVDGTGAAPVTADVRVRDGVITEVGPGLRPDGERQVDAAGALVTPGLIEPHTHYDGGMWWDPSLEPLPAYGVTSVVMGNCGVSIAPLAGSQREEIVDLFCFLEDLPKVAFDAEVPWNWETWPEYRKALEGRPAAANVAGYLGHLSLRTYVMGDAAWERAATDGEQDRMARLLDASLAAGALGLSSNLFDRDRRQRPVSSWFADDAEYETLLDVLGRHPGTTLQLITQFDDADSEKFSADVRRLAAMAKTRGVRGQWTVIPAGVQEAERRAEALELHRQLRADGADFWPVVPHMASHIFYNFDKSLAFLRVPAWHDMINGPTEDKVRLLADPAWRARARDDWDNRRLSTNARLDHPDRIFLALSENGTGPVDVTWSDYASGRNLHVSDALAEWLLANGIGSALRARPEDFDEESVARILRDPHTLTNINDCGAHLQLFCGAGQNLYLLTRYVRETGLLELPEAVHLLTQRAATFFGLHDRGVIAPGKAGDLAVFALDEIDIRPEVRRHDVPGGSWRYSREPAGFRATIVDGSPTFIDGAATGEQPGRLRSPQPVG